MKLLCLVVLGLICVGVNSHLLGATECTWGPSYWCKNITNAKECGAVTHCVQTVWTHQKVQEDGDSVCKICLEMVKEARDTLNSNETQEELKEVFEGSCKLIPISIVRDACITLADDFVPELVETLSSQMNPMVVCTVAGLCNNAWVDKQIEEYNKDKPVVVPSVPLAESLEVGMDDCQQCNVVVDALENRLKTTSRDEILNNMLQACGRLGSLSDSCSAIIITYFSQIHDFLQANLKSDGVCHMAGVCSGKFHSHRPQPQRVEVVHESNVGVMKPNDNLPCEFCEQLVIHLRDMLVANTTEEEFEHILQGLCKQTHSFKDECLSLVTEYYAVVYNFLVNSLQASEICKLAGLCGPTTAGKGPIWPLLPAQAVTTLKESGMVTADTVSKLKSIPLVPANSVGTIQALPLVSAQTIETIKSTLLVPADAVQLPVDRMLPKTIIYVNNKEVCEFCQLFLHYVQQAITSPETESKIESVVRNACNHLPDSIQGQCREFVETYGNAFIALLAQEIDPSQVCPRLGLCPGEDKTILLDLEHTVNDKPTCPFCLLALTSLINKLKDKKTEEEIKNELEHLCLDLPKSLADECNEFVSKYADEVINMIIADFTPQEICTYIRLCDPTKTKIGSTPVPDILSNEIPDYPVKKFMKPLPKKKTPVSDGTYCIICEFVMSKIDNLLQNETTEEEIKNLVKDVCNYLPKTVATECDKFVDEYADLVIALLTQSITPDEVCKAMKLCKSATYKHAVLVDNVKKSVKKCAVCEASMGALDELMSDPNVQEGVDKLLEKICPLLPAQDRDECREIINVYGPSILNLISTVADPRLVCMEIGLCNFHMQTVHLLGGKQCSWGPGYWCQSVIHANACDTLDYCQEKIWKAKKPANN